MLIHSSGPYNIITGKGLCGFRIQPQFDTVFIFSTKLWFFYLFIHFLYKYYDCNRTHEWRACQCSLVTSRLLVHKILFHSDLRLAALWYGPVHSHLPPTAPPPDLLRPQRVLRHEKLGNYVTWPPWENWNVILFNWCLYNSEISDCKHPQPDNCTTIFCFIHMPLLTAMPFRFWAWRPIIECLLQI